MATTILGIFDDPAAARRAMDELRGSSLDLDDVSIIARATESGAAAESGEHISAGEGAAVGAVWGGLVGLASLLIPGVGPFVAGGALFAALTGAATGAVVGGVAGALMDSAGLSEEEARSYETIVHSGKTLVAVKSREEAATEVRRILASAGANSVRDNQTDITGLNMPVDVATGDAAGRGVEQELEYGATGPYGTRGIYDMPTVMRDTDAAAAARTEATNMAAGTEDPYGTGQIPPGDEGRTIETRGWDRVGHVGDRQGERFSPPPAQRTPDMPPPEDKPE